MPKPGISQLLATEDAAAALNSVASDETHGAFVVDGAGIVIAANAGAMTLLSLSSKEILGCKFWDLPSWRSRHAARALERILTLASESTHDEDVRFGLNLGTENEPQHWEFKVSPASLKRPAALLVVDAQRASQPPPAVTATTEEALRFKFSFETARVGPWSWNIIDDRLTAHPVLADLFAWPEGFDFTNSGGFYAMVHPDDREPVAKEVKKAVQSGSRLELEYRIIRPDGSVHWIAALGGIERDEAGVATHVHGITLEITERKQAAEALQKSEEKFRLMFENCPAGMIITDRAGVVSSANQAFCAFVQRNANALQGSNFFALIHLDDAQTVQMHLFDADCYDCEGMDVRYLLPGGEILWGHTNTMHLSDASGAPLSVLVVQDMTAQKRAEAILRESEERFRIVANDTPAYLWVTNGEDKNSFINRSCRDFLGVDSNEIATDWMQYVHHDDRESAYEAFLKALYARVSFESVFRIRRYDGENRWILCRAAPRFSLLQEFLGYAGSMLDITERRRAEDDARNAVARLEYELAQRIRAEHDIRALTEKLIDAQESERTRIARELHDDLSQQVAALSLGVSNVRRQIGATKPELLENIDRLHSGLVVLAKGIRFISHRLHPAIIEQAGVSAALKSYCTEFTALTGIRVHFSAEGATRDAGPAQSLCLYRIAQEALQNVAKHSRSDVAELALTREGNSLRMTISDRGVGYNPQNAKQGLGFVSIRERVRLVDGSVSITTGEGGTTVDVTVPVNCPPPS